MAPDADRVRSDRAARAFSAGRVGALMLRHWYLMRGSIPRLLELAYWPIMQVITWGFITKFLATAGGSSLIAEAAGLFIAAALLWDVMFRGNLGVSLSFMEEMWARNLGHLFVSPLRPLELVTALTAMSIIRSLIGILPATLLAWLLHAYNVYDLGLPLLLFFVGPESYTGMDLAELQCPGHPALLDHLLQQLFAVGVRAAEPGEFTFHAYLAGKLDLTQAEGIHATITAESDAQLRAAGLLRHGQLTGQIRQTVDELATALALTEAGIDFVDQDDVVAITPAQLLQRIDDQQAQVARVLERSRSWGELQGLPRVVLVGPPSVGKSTLFNRLLGQQRAVTDAQPGTTRDVLTERCTWQDKAGQRCELMLSDIAGLNVTLRSGSAESGSDGEQAERKTAAQSGHGQQSSAVSDAMEQAAHRAVAEADVVVELYRDAPMPSAARPPHTGRWLSIRSQSDLDAASPGDAAGAGLSCSAVTGVGISALREAVMDAITGRDAGPIAGDVLALQPRHESSLRAALDHLADARAQVAPHVNELALPDLETVADALRMALNALAGMGGDVSPDDIIGRVFASFCVGK